MRVGIDCVDLGLGKFFGIRIFVSKLDVAKDDSENGLDKVDFLKFTLKMMAISQKLALQSCLA